MSSYMLLMLEPPEQRRTRTRAEGEAVFARMLQFAEELKSQGVLRGVESLSAHSQAARVQVRAGQPRVVDGPFAEAKEMIGGFYLIDVPTRDAGDRHRPALPGGRMVHGRGALARPLLRREQRLIASPRLSKTARVVRRVNEAWSHRSRASKTEHDHAIHDSGEGHARDRARRDAG